MSLFTVVFFLRPLRESIIQYRKQIFILLFQRLQGSKTTKFVKSEYCHLTVCGTSDFLFFPNTFLSISNIKSRLSTCFPGFLVFVNLYCVKYGAIALQEIFDSIQPK